MRKVIVMLIVLLNFTLIAQPALAEAPSEKMIFQEKLADSADTTYFNPENSTTLAQDLNLTDGVYKGPQYPFAAVKLDIRDYTEIYLNYTLNVSYQNIMNGVWDWDILIPLRGEFEKWGLYVDGTFIGGNYQEWDETGNIEIANKIFSNKTTKYGTLLEIYYALYPGQHNISFYATASNNVILNICREKQASTLTLMQHNKTVYEINAAFAFLFKRGFGQEGMGAIVGRNISFYFLDSTNSNTTYITIGLPVWIPRGTRMTLEMHEYVNGSEIFYINRTFQEAGFYYIFQSTSRPANWSRTDYVSAEFSFTFTNPVKFLFCAQAPTPHQFGADGEYEGNTIQYEGRDFDYFGIVFWHHVGSDQYALVEKRGNVTIYDFGFARVEEYSTGDYVIYAQGNWKKYVVIKNITVKSIGAKVDDMLFGGKFSFSSNNDILSILLGGIGKIYDLLKQTWQFLRHLGEIIWQYLMKFVKFLINLASWIWDNLGGIFNYLLYLFIPIATMFIISYTARWAKGLRATDEKGVSK